MVRSLTLYMCHVGVAKMVWYIYMFVTYYCYSCFVDRLKSNQISMAWQLISFPDCSHFTVCMHFHCCSPVLHTCIHTPVASHQRAQAEQTAEGGSEALPSGSHHAHPRVLHKHGLHQSKAVHAQLGSVWSSYWSCVKVSGWLGGCVITMQLWQVFRALL